MPLTQDKMQLPLWFPNSSAELKLLTRDGVQLPADSQIQCSPQHILSALQSQTLTVSNTTADPRMPRAWQPRSSRTDIPQIPLLAWVLCLL